MSTFLIRWRPLCDDIERDPVTDTVSTDRRTRVARAVDETYVRVVKE